MTVHLETKRRIAIGPELGGLLDVARGAGLAALLVGKHGISKSEYLESYARERGIEPYFRTATATSHASRRPARCRRATRRSRRCSCSRSRSAPIARSQRPPESRGTWLVRVLWVAGSGWPY